MRNRVERVPNRSFVAFALSLLIRLLMSTWFESNIVAAVDSCIRRLTLRTIQLLSYCSATVSRLGPDQREVLRPVYHD
ncbi:hypothetical protein BDP81DRAFT_420715 [Colletotrichum phormii]|uniref:Uncharacterized protein n=1 Tax=Colletotrichum phormii TaxID=359342 RepID=A0AAI9ZW46_9PEZI|nr:uncharacterized protein BDP81DRAFT_420715 [Colletotrichum phormii]KAK1639305.1 hypothetical protein BDP81DRAFT_420715 [Colletotrichum phormii]